MYIYVTVFALSLNATYGQYPELKSGEMLNSNEL